MQSNGLVEINCGFECFHYDFLLTFIQPDSNLVEQSHENQIVVLNGFVLLFFHVDPLEENFCMFWIISSKCLGTLPNIIYTKLALLVKQNLTFLLTKFSKNYVFHIN
jgi:hypothetical protein